MAALVVGEPLALVVHILNANAADLAQRAGVVQERVRGFSMDVNFHQRAVADNNGGFAARAHLGADCVNVQADALQDELSAVAVLFLFGHIKEIQGHRRALHVHALRQRHIKRIRRSIVANGAAADALQYHPQPQAAGVHHARLLQARQQRGREGYRALGGGACGGKHIGGIRAVLIALRGGVGGMREHREHRPLNRIADSAIGVLARQAQGARQVGRAHRRLVLKGVVYALEQLGYDKPAIALSAHARAVGHRLGNAGRGIGVGVLRGGEGIAQGEQHIYARIAVLHGEDVEPVHKVDVRLKNARALGEHSQQFAA